MEDSRSVLTPTARPSHRRFRITATLSAAVLAAALLVACAPTGATSSKPSASAAIAIVLPDTVLGEHAQWVIEAINGAEVSPAEVESRLATPVLEQVPADQLIVVFTQLAPQKPWVPTAIQDAGDQATITITPPRAMRWTCRSWSTVMI